MTVRIVLELEDPIWPIGILGFGAVSAILLSALLHRRSVTSRLTRDIAAIVSRLRSLEARVNGVAIKQLKGDGRGMRNLEEVGCLYEVCLRLVESAVAVRERINERPHRLSVRQDPLAHLVTEQHRSLHGALMALSPTERSVLESLASQGAKSSRDLLLLIGRSREHTARLMKKLYLQGYVDRVNETPPFVYRINEKIGAALKAVPPTP